MKVLQVAKFEIYRNLKKPSFWLAAIMVPIILVAYLMIVAFTSYSAGEQLVASSDTSNLRIGITDDANYLNHFSFINSDGVEQTLSKLESRDAGIKAVTDNQLDIFYYIPANFDTELSSVEIHVKHGEAGLFDDYSAPISSLLNTEAKAQTEPINYAIIANEISYNTTNYHQADNHIVNLDETVSRMVAPIIAIVLFYLILVLLGNRLTVAMVEEKENRISELLLTSVKPIDLIFGKTFSLMVLGVIQILAILIPAFLLFLIAKNNNLLPNITISLNFSDIAVSLILLICSYFMFTAFSILVGTLSSTARDANSYAGILVIITILPMMFINAFSVEAPSTLGYVLTYFPPSAPIALMLRNIFNNLQSWEMIVGILEILTIGILTLQLAAHIFCHNAVGLTAKFNFKKILGEPRKEWRK